MAETTREGKLTTDLADSRAALTEYVQALRHDFDVGTRFKSSVKTNHVAWFGAAAVLGLLLSMLPPGRRKVVVRGPVVRNGQVEKAGKAAFALTALKFGLDFAKPALMSWAKQHLFAGRRPATPAK